MVTPVRRRRLVGGARGSRGAWPSETPADIEAFLTANEGTSLAVAGNADGRLSAAYQVTQPGTAVILDPSGRPVSRIVEPTGEQLQAALAALPTH